MGVWRLQLIEYSTAEWCWVTSEVKSWKANFSIELHMVLPMSSMYINYSYICVSCNCYSTICLLNVYVLHVCLFINLKFKKVFFVCFLLNPFTFFTQPCNAPPHWQLSGCFPSICLFLFCFKALKSFYVRSVFSLMGLRVSCKFRRVLFSPRL